MNENDFYHYNRDDENKEETSRGASVEYGPSDYNAYYGPKRKNKGGLIATLVLVAFLLLGIGVACGSLLTPNVGDVPSGDTGADGEGTNGLGGTKPEYDSNVIVQVTDENAVIKDGSVASVVQKCDASVVEIMTSTTSVGGNVTAGAGSGVIFGVKDNYTYIVTNNHVIEGAENVRVQTVDGTEYDAVLMGTDWLSDVAVLRIEAKGLKPATLAKSANLTKGQEVVVIGNPLGSLGGSVTDGVLSGLERTITIEGVPMTLLQVSAAVNPGNSGGGLFDMNGNLIGVVNAKSYGEQVDNIGFAIPIDEAYAVCQQLLAQGYVSGRADLGFTFSGATSGYGVQINSYAYNGETGNKVQEGDWLYSVTMPSGKAVVIDSTSDYKSILANLKIGDTVTLTVCRLRSNGFLVTPNSYTLQVTVKEYRPTSN